MGSGRKSDDKKGGEYLPGAQEVYVLAHACPQRSAARAMSGTMLLLQIITIVGHAMLPGVHAAMVGHARHRDWRCMCGTHLRH